MLIISARGQMHRLQRGYGRSNCVEVSSVKDRELKKLSRADLLQLLIERTRENETMSERLKDLQEQLDIAKTQLENRTIAIENAGSLAEAALQINGMIEATQRTAQQYLDNIKLMQQEQERKCAELEAQKRGEADQLIRDAERKCREMEAQAKSRYDELMKNAERDADRNWEELSERLRKISQENENLRHLLTENQKKRKWLL